jgi:hypothetical protein
VDNIIKGFREGTLYAAEFVNPCIDAKSIIDPIIAGGGSFAGWRYYVTQWQSTSTIMFLMYNRARFDPAETGLLRVAAAASLAASYRRLETKQSACLAVLGRGERVRALADRGLEAGHPSLDQAVGGAARLGGLGGAEDDRLRRGAGDGGAQRHGEAARERGRVQAPAARLPHGRATMVAE